MPKVVNVTMTPAIMTPQAMDMKALLKGIPKTNAHKEAVQAPVNGAGMATKSVKAKSLHCSKALVCFFLVLSKSHLKNLLKKFERRLKKPETGPSDKRIKIIGTTLPNIEIKKADQTGIW